MADPTKNTKSVALTRVYPDSSIFVLNINFSHTLSQAIVLAINKQTNEINMLPNNIPFVSVFYLKLEINQ